MTDTTPTDEREAFEAEWERWQISDGGKTTSTIAIGRYFWQARAASQPAPSNAIDPEVFEFQSAHRPVKASQLAQEPTAIAKAYAAGFADGHKAASQPAHPMWNPIANRWEVVDPNSPTLRSEWTAEASQPAQEPAAFPQLEIQRLRDETQKPKKCGGIPRPGCNYFAECDSVCNKCGKVHSSNLLLMTEPAQEPVALGALLDEYLHAGREAYKVGRETPRVSAARVAIVNAFHATQQQAEPVACTFGCTTQEEHDAHYAAPPADDEAVRLLETLRTTLERIANVKVSEWEEGVRDQFEAWARSRAGHSVVAIDAYLAKVTK